MLSRVADIDQAKLVSHREFDKSATASFGARTANLYSNQALYYQTKALTTTLLCRFSGVMLIVISIALYTFL